MSFSLCYIKNFYLFSSDRICEYKRYVFLYHRRCVCVSECRYAGERWEKILDSKAEATLIALCIVSSFGSEF